MIIIELYPFLIVLLRLSLFHDVTDIKMNREAVFSCQVLTDCIQT